MALGDLTLTVWLTFIHWCNSQTLLSRKRTHVQKNICRNFFALCVRERSERIFSLLLCLSFFLNTYFLVFVFCRNPDASQRIDLSLLCPLWDLYLGLSKNASNKSGHLPPPVERALTELFLHAENLAVVSIYVPLLWVTGRVRLKITRLRSYTTLKRSSLYWFIKSFFILNTKTIRTDLQDYSNWQKNWLVCYLF